MKRWNQRSSFRNSNRLPLSARCIKVFLLYINYNYGDMASLIHERVRYGEGTLFSGHVYWPWQMSTDKGSLGQFKGLSVSSIGFLHVQTLWKKHIKFFVLELVHKHQSRCRWEDRWSKARPDDDGDSLRLARRLLGLVWDEGHFWASCKWKWAVTYLGWGA